MSLYEGDEAGEMRRVRKDNKLQTGVFQPLMVCRYRRCRCDCGAFRYDKHHPFSASPAVHGWEINGDKIPSPVHGAYLKRIMAG